VKERQQLLGPGIAHPEENRLGLLPGGDETFLTQLREVLGQGRLAKANADLELTNRNLPTLRQVAQNQQANLVGHGFQKPHRLI